MKIYEENDKGNTEELFWQKKNCQYNNAEEELNEQLSIIFCLTKRQRGKLKQTMKKSHLSFFPMEIACDLT